jgi:hypothetical protein
METLDRHVIARMFLPESATHQKLINIATDHRRKKPHGTAQPIPLGQRHSQRIFIDIQSKSSVAKSCFPSLKLAVVQVILSEIVSENVGLREIFSVPICRSIPEKNQQIFVQSFVNAYFDNRVGSRLMSHLP